MTVTQQQAEMDFKYGILPGLRQVHGENKEVFQEEWVLHLKELARERKIPNHVVNEWKISF